MIALTTPIKTNVPVITTVEKTFTHVWIQQLVIDATAPESPLVSFNLLPCNADATEFAPTTEVKNVTIQNIFDPANMTAEVVAALRAIEAAVLEVAKTRGII